MNSQNNLTILLYSLILHAPDHYFMPTIDASSCLNKDRKTLHRKLLARCHHSGNILKTFVKKTSCFACIAPNISV